MPQKLIKKEDSPELFVRSEEGSEEKFTPFQTDTDDQTKKNSAASNRWIGSIASNIRHLFGDGIGGANSKCCPICLEQYKDGDDVCWSKNKDCGHAFHFTCIKSWLMTHEDCPLCRADYLALDEIPPKVDLKDEARDLADNQVSSTNAVVDRGE